MIIATDGVGNTNEATASFIVNTEKDELTLGSQGYYIGFLLIVVLVLALAGIILIVILRSRKKKAIVEEETSAEKGGSVSRSPVGQGPGPQHDPGVAASEEIRPKPEDGIAHQARYQLKDPRIQQKALPRGPPCETGTPLLPMGMGSSSSSLAQAPPGTDPIDGPTAFAEGNVPPTQQDRGGVPPLPPSPASPPVMSSSVPQRSTSQEPQILGVDDIFEIKDLFLIYVDGRLINQVSFDSKVRVDMDEDIMSGMLTAITDFIKDSFSEETGALKTLQYGKMTIFLERGVMMYIAVVFKGHPPLDLRKKMRWTLIRIWEKYKIYLKVWDGSYDGLDDLAGVLGELMAAEEVDTAGADESDHPREEDISKPAVVGYHEPRISTADQSVTCSICYGVIKSGLPLVTCSCNKRYHESCAGRVGTCPVCKASLGEFYTGDAPPPPPVNAPPATGRLLQLVQNKGDPVGLDDIKIGEGDAAPNPLPGIARPPNEFNINV